MSSRKLQTAFQNPYTLLEKDRGIVRKDSIAFIATNVFDWIVFDFAFLGYLMLFYRSYNILRS